MAYRHGSQALTSQTVCDHFQGIARAGIEKGAFMPLALPFSSDDFPVWVDPPNTSHRRSMPLPGGRPADLSTGSGGYDPTGVEMEFRDALRDFRPADGRLFPTWDEVLGLIRRLGY